MQQRRAPHPRRAGEAYAETWHLLAESDLPEAERAGLRQPWFGQPVELPAAGVLWSGAQDDTDFSEGSVIIARLDVNSRGRPRNIDTSARDPEHDGKAVRLYRLLRDTRFRPRLEEGEVVDTLQMVREYRLN